MAILSNETATGMKDCIANNLPSRAFRYATESKNVLSSAGAIYVGTGIKRTTIMMLDGGTPVSYDSYITAVLEVDNANDALIPKSVQLKYKDGSPVYVVTIDGEDYLANSGDAGAHTYTQIFPCWVKNAGGENESIIAPKIIG